MSHSLDLPALFKERGEVNFDYLPRKGDYKKLKYGTGAGLLKMGELTLFLINLLKVHHFYI